MVVNRKDGIDGHSRNGTDPRDCDGFKVKTKERRQTKNLKGASSGELEVSQ